MPTKEAGLCPFCNNEVSAVVVEENILRRDKCKCPECDKTIYLCRAPGCNNYAKGTENWDNELCPSCTETAGGIVKEGATIAASLVAEVIVGKNKK